MDSSVKITIIGAGSAQFSAEIIRDLCVSPGLQGSHVALMDIHEQRLEMVYRLARRLAAEIGAEIGFSKTTNREAALRGADFVINTAQTGGHGWTEAQRVLAEKHGYYRGARLHDFPQMALFLEVARDVERLCPHAWLIQSANPVFEGCTLMHRETKVKVLGLCHGHYGYLQIARVLGLDPEFVTAETKGFNHWIWLTDFRYKGEDAYPLLDEWIDKHAEAYWAQDNFEFHDTQMSRAAIDQYKLYGLMPIGDTPRFAGWWYHTDLAAKQRWYGSLGGFDSERGWQRYLHKMEGNVRQIERAVTDEAGRVTDIFRPVQGREQIVPIIDSLVNDNECCYQVNIPNEGQLVQGFPDDLVIECKGVVSAAGIRGAASPPLPDKVVIGEMIPRWRRAECAVTAMRSGDPDYLLHYLLHDQRTRSRGQAEGLLAEWLQDPRNAQLAAWFGGAKQQ
ncbi:alpha-glucosidase/alpha-galactosidase [Paenibacillus piri]|uniref:Alpha-glucosidase/alpha-galactosidase n=1 Tax=Paenibacillus piri TaxID=2547395 RepID=A0A4V2ZSX8_9BACL|nr:alpha-glucosidase/alpha-galactosidase [Paenibacillus piri]TDF94834.1 alpha-glucosidase/alpha-galactosidase [Paenibacillus piri]